MSQPTPVSRRTSIAIGAASAALTLAALVTAGGLFGVLRSPSAAKPAAQIEAPSPSIVLVPIASSAAPEAPLPSEPAPALGATHERDDDDDDDQDDERDDDRAGENEARSEHHRMREHREHREHRGHHEREEHDDG